MRQLPPVTRTANRTIVDRDNWVAGSLLVTVIGLPALLAFMAVPGIVLGAALGVATLKLGEGLYCRVVRLVAQQGTTTQTGCNKKPQATPGN